MLYQNGWKCNPVRFSQVLLGILCWMVFACFATHQVDTCEITSHVDDAHIHFNLSGSDGYKVFTLDNPDRVVIDLKNARWKVKPGESEKDLLVSDIRRAVNNEGTLRIVLDMQKPARIVQHKLESTSGGEKILKLQLTLHDKHNVPKTENKKSESEPQKKSVNLSVVKQTRPFIVAIDPGHGGEDTGAIGYKKRLREKDIVLEVSKKLQAMINAEPGMKAFLSREGDYYIGLRKRMTIAREQRADLFISVHADSFEDPRARGAAVYVLSEKGASNEAARWLAEKENRSDLIGGVSLDNKNPILASVLLDLSQTASQAASQELGAHLVKSLAKTTDLHHKTVQSAGFMVLKSPDIPSVLIELGFISNVEGEKQLVDPKHQRALATAILTGVKAYAHKRPAHLEPQNTMIANKKSSIKISSKN